MFKDDDVLVGMDVATDAATAREADGGDSVGGNGGFLNLFGQRQAPSGRHARARVGVAVVAVVSVGIGGDELPQGRAVLRHFDDLLDRDEGQVPDRFPGGCPRRRSWTSR